MPGGKRGHKLRHYMRRVDRVLEEEQGRRGPPPPPISAEHLALRERILEEYRAIEWDPNFRDRRGDPMCTPESAHHAAEVVGLMFEEQRFLAERGVNWRLYDNYQLD